MVDTIPLDAEQESAVQYILSNPRKRVVLTGQAGSGKSTCINHLRKVAGVFLSATTGRAAINIGGCTVDTLFSIDRDKWQTRNPTILDRNMRIVPDIIVIDEASMIGDKMAGMILHAAEKYGKQLVLVGDFAQAAPVKEELGVTHPLFMEAERIDLKKCHRQADSDYLKALNTLRLGELDDHTRAIFRTGVSTTPGLAMEMFATNAAADRLNLAELTKIKLNKSVMKTSFHDLRDPAIAKSYPVPGEKIARLLANSPLANFVGVKVGARVMVTYNIYDGPSGIESVPICVNGDLGTVESIFMYADNKLCELPAAPAKFGEPAPEVAAIRIKLDRTGKSVDLPKLSISIYEMSQSPAYELVGFPLALGWAVTIHKSQGMTLPKASIDIRTICSMPPNGRHGLAYVGLSRTRRVQDLTVTNWSDEAVYCRPELKPFII